MEFQILSFCLLACAIFNLILFIMALVRLYRICTTKNSLKISYSFYASMLFATLSRSLCFYFMSGYLEPQYGLWFVDTLLYLLIVIPDMLNICVYMFLVWYFYANYILSHIHLANDLNLFMRIDNPTISSKTYRLLFLIIFVFIIASVVICLLTVFEVLQKETLFSINSIFNMSCPFLFMAYYSFLTIKFSGRPYINEKLKTQVHRILIVVIIWSVARLSAGILGVVLSTSFINAIIQDKPSNQNNIGYVLKIMVYFVLTEFIPDFMSLDYTFMLTYIRENNRLIDDSLLVNIFFKIIFLGR